ncbi:MAG: hypothetical protein SPI65_02920 [Peptoniphilus sp.]|nr:hypothetical protein [Peptoniphilus sp.]MDD7363163.1 hypothetical protein [Bacillota bacterium]MDY6044513.1 hypothetical protein [Peptoniphilus sp.]
MRATMRNMGLTDKSSIRRSAWLLVFLAIIACDVFPGFYFQDKIPHGAAIFLVCGGYFLLFGVALYLIRRFLRRWVSSPVIETMLVAILAYNIHRLINSTASLGPSAGMWLKGIAGVLTLGLWLFAYGMERRRERPLLTAVGAVSLACVAFVALFPGVRMRGEIHPAAKAIPPTYDVEVVHYGPGEDYDFGTENYARYVTVPKYQDKLRKRHLGYTPSRVPYEGELYMPKGKRHTPLLVFVHGNHNMVEDNMGGYDYLGRYLAARGISFASIDQSHFNAFMQRSMSNENDARALGLIDHAAALLADPRLADRFDKDRLYFGGHSRGGEAAAIAASFVELSHNPDTGEKVKDLRVAGVLAVAPTDGQYQPAAHPVALRAPYLFVQGVYDQDVSSLEGMDQYMRAEGEKRQILIQYANHTQFNDNWGRLDREGLNACTLRTADLMDTRDQQAFLEVLAYGFIEDPAIFSALKDYVPDAGFMMASEKPGVVLANFEEDADLATGTAEGVAIDLTSGVHTEGNFAPSGRGGANHVAYVVGEFTLDTPVGGAGDFAFDAAPIGTAPTVEVTLEDEDGERVSATFNRETLTEPFETRLLKWQDLAGRSENKSALETCRIRDEAMREKNPNFHMERLRRVTIATDAEIALDNIRIEP